MSVHRYGAHADVSTRPTNLDQKMRANRMPPAAMQCSPHTSERSTATAFDKRSGRSHPAPARYDGITRFFHWTFAACIVYASVAGYSLSRVANGPVHHFLSQLNMSIGTVLMVLFPLRFGWKMLRTEPRALRDVPAWQQSLAHGVHGVLYLAMFAVLASGFLMVPNGYAFFGVVEIHTPFRQGALTDELFAVHRASCAVLAGLVVLHVLAVVKHQLITRNDVLRRML